MIWSSYRCAGREVWATTAHTIRTIHTQSAACLGGFATDKCVPVGQIWHTDAKGHRQGVWHHRRRRIQFGGVPRVSATWWSRHSMSTVRTTGPCQIFMNEERCINECPVAEQQRGVCAEPRALALAEAARGKSTVDIGLHI